MNHYTLHTSANWQFTSFYMIKVISLLLSCLLFISSAYAEELSVYKKSADLPLEEVYNAVYIELEQRNFHVIFEVNIGKNIARFKDKWSKEYNQNKLIGIRSMVFCNAWFANRVSNVDPNMLALCPLRLTVIEHSAQSHILFVRPSVIGKDSPALAILTEIEETVIDAIDAAME
ncbi:MAG: DUF302 domain-containing protein [Cycloclasticus sp.]